MAFVGRAEPRWGPHYLRDLATSCLAKVEDAVPKSIDSLKHWLNAKEEDAKPKEFSWGSGCSGTDSPQWTFAGIKEAFRGASMDINFSHIVSAEKDPAKRNFLEVMASPEALAGDVFDISAEWCYDHAHKRYVKPALMFTSLMCFIAGFVCKSVSMLNNHVSTANEAVWNTATSTGSTLWAVLLFAQRMRPVSIILENVYGLLRTLLHCYTLGMWMRRINS